MLVNPTVDGVLERRISWGGVLAGFFFAITCYLFLGLLGTAIGASAIDPTGDRNPLAGFGTGLGLWVGVTTLIALAVGAYVAGRTAPNRGMLHGALCWAVTTLITVYALSSLAGGVVGTAARVAGSGVAMVGQGVGAAVPGITSAVGDQLKKNGVDIDPNNVVDSARREFEKLLQQTGKPELSPSALQSAASSAAKDGRAAASQAATTPQNSGDDLSAFFDRLRQRAQPQLDAADKEALVNIVMARTGQSRPEAEKIVANYQQTYEQAMAKMNELKAQAEQKAREAADAAAKGVSRAAWAAVVSMVLGLAVSLLASAFGFRHRLREQPL